MKTILSIGLGLYLSACVNGPKGEIGDTGADGGTPYVSVRPAEAANCSSGGVILTTGTTETVICNGLPGVMGPVGPSGNAGQSCTITSTIQGSTIICADASSQVLNGTNGVDGVNGTDGADATPVIAEALCPTISGGLFQEHVLHIGSGLYAVYASGSNIGFAKLSPGNWVTTDGRNCHFTISINLEVGY